MWILKECISWNVKLWSPTRIPVRNPSLKSDSWITMGFFFTTVRTAGNLWRPCLLLLEDCHAILLTGKECCLQLCSWKILIWSSTWRLRWRQGDWELHGVDPAPAFSLTQSSVTVIVSGHVYLVPKLTGAGMCCCNVWCSGTLTPAAALALMTANVGGRDGAFFSPNAGADGCCQGVLGLQQATEVTFLVLVNIIKHNEKKICSVCEGLWVIYPESLAHTHVFLTAVGNTHLKWNLVSSCSSAFVLIIFPRERGELEVWREMVDAGWASPQGELQPPPCSPWEAG